MPAVATLWLSQTGRRCLVRWHSPHTQRVRGSTPWMPAELTKGLAHSHLWWHTPQTWGWNSEETRFWSFNRYQGGLKNYITSKLNEFSLNFTFISDFMWYTWTPQIPQKPQRNAALFWSSLFSSSSSWPDPSICCLSGSSFLWSSEIRSDPQSETLI